MALDIISRQMWGASHEFNGLAINFPATHVYAMNIKPRECYGVKECSPILQEMQLFHMQTKNLGDIRFNFIIGGDGAVYEGRGWFYQPSLPYNRVNNNRSSLLIAYVGNYIADNLPQVMSDAAKKLVDHGINHRYIDPMFMYRDISKLMPVRERESYTMYQRDYAQANAVRNYEQDYPY